MTVRHSLFATAFACTGFYTTAVDAQLGRPTQSRPVTAADIVGKKICWDDGHWGFYATNGEFSNDSYPGLYLKWSVPEPGVIRVGKRYRPAKILPNGQFYSDFFCGRCGSITGHFEHWGTVCN